MAITAQTQLQMERSNNMNIEQMYSLKSAAEKLDISIRTLRRLIKKHGIKISRVGKNIRIPESELMELIVFQPTVDDIMY